MEFIHEFSYLGVIKIQNKKLITPFGSILFSVQMSVVFITGNVYVCIQVVREAPRFFGE